MLIFNVSFNADWMAQFLKPLMLLVDTVSPSRDFQVLSLEKNDNQFAELKKKDQCHTC
ncbi:17737_t:CDS:2, partial [Racocetra persica]